MILIVGRLDDPHTKLVADALDRKGRRWAAVDTGAFLANRISLRQQGTRWTGRLKTADAEIDVETVRSVWYRRIAPIQPPPGLGREDQLLALGEGQLILDGLWRILGDRRWVNSPAGTDAATSKLHASDVAARAGFRVPTTLLTNDPADLKPFYDAHPQGIVYKTLSQHTRSKDGQRQGIFTTKVRPQDLDRAASIAKAPCCFQELVPKRADWRVIAIGSRLFPCEIASQGSDRTKVDYRSEAEQLPHRLAALPPEVDRLCRKVMADLGLLFGCIDLVETPEGDFHFLEVNPSGNWYWIEQQTGAPLLETFVDLLSGGAL